MKREQRISLNAKLLMVQLGSLCLALAIFFGGMTLGTHVLNRYYLSPEAERDRLQAYVLELSRFVQQNDIASTDSAALESWAREKKYVYLAVYRGATPVLETDGYATSHTDGDPSKALESEEQAAETLEADRLTPDADGCYRLRFADGIFRVAIKEVSETPYYDLVVILSLVIACLAMMLVNLAHNHHVTRAIIRLSKEVQWVEQGAREAVVQSSRKDEIGELARSVERMRRSVIQRTQSEQDAWAANSGLITAISHDVRTPLTALMGYLDLLEGGQYQNPQQMKRYLHASREKARQLKELTDELFRYFLVFATPDMKLDLQAYDAVILTEQLLGERMIRLEENGFKLHCTPLRQSCRVRVDVAYLQRVLDNLFNNIEKHADRRLPVHVLVRWYENFLVIDLANGVPDRPNTAESTKIGLQTCHKIIREMGGVFETHLEGRRFLAEITLPLAPTEDDHQEENT